MTSSIGVGEDSPGATLAGWVWRWWRCVVAGWGTNRRGASDGSTRPRHGVHGGGGTACIQLASPWAQRSYELCTEGQASWTLALGRVFGRRDPVHHHRTVHPQHPLLPYAVRNLRPGKRLSCWLLPPLLQGRRRPGPGDTNTLTHTRRFFTHGPCPAPLLYLPRSGPCSPPPPPPSLLCHSEGRPSPALVAAPPLPRRPRAPTDRCPRP